MKQKKLLLPHSFQNFGWIMFLLSGIFILATNHFQLIKESITIFSIDFTPLIVLLTTSLPILCIMIICISQEKHEDEYIRALRSRYILCIVVFYFLTEMGQLAFSRCAIMYQVGPFYQKMISILGGINNVYTLSLAYLVLFKVTMFINNLNAQKDGK